MVPDKYIDQLHADILSCYKKPKELTIDDFKAEVDNNSLQADIDTNFNDANLFEDVEKYLAFDFDNEPTFGEIIGLKVEQFPDEKLLTIKQVRKLYNSFLDMIDSYNLKLDIPENIPVRIGYKAAITILNDVVFLAGDGQMRWELCAYDSTKCLYGKYCYCIQSEAEDERDLDDAHDMLLAIIDACAEQGSVSGSCKLVCVDRKIEEERNPLCVYIGGGSYILPWQIYHQAHLLEDACNAIIKLFPDNPDTHSAFEDISKFKVHISLQALLSLEVFEYIDNVFYTEPFYVEDAILYKGHAPSYTPEQLLAKLESEVDDRDYGINDDEYYNNDDLPF